MFAVVEADSTAERVARDADIWSRTVQGRETQLGRPRQEVAPKRARTNPRGACISINLYATKPVRA